MRTAAICPTCATYENAVCVIYNGDNLTNINVSTLMNLETAFVNIDTAVGSLSTFINNVASNPVVVTTDGTSGPATFSGNVINVPNYQPPLQDVLGYDNHASLPIYLEDSTSSPVNTITINPVDSNSTPQINLHSDPQNWDITIGNESIYVPMVKVSNLTSDYSSIVYDNGFVINDSAQTTKTEYLTYNFSIKNTSTNDNSTIQYPTTASNSTIYFPNNSGTLALSVNGIGADLGTGDITLPIAQGWELTGNSGTTPGTDFIGTTDNQDVVFKANNVEYARLKATTVGNDDISLSKNVKLESASSQIWVSESTNGGYVLAAANASNRGYLTIAKDLGSYATIKGTNLTTGRTLQLPDKNGTLATTSDIELPYKVYSAIVKFDLGSMVVVQELQNTTGVTFSFATYGAISEITASSSLFTTNKTVFIGNSFVGSAVYNVIGYYFSSTVFQIIAYDTNTQSPAVDNGYPFFIEIRVYP